MLDVMCEYGGEGGASDTDQEDYVYYAHNTQMLQHVARPCILAGVSNRGGLTPSLDPPF